MINNVIFFRQRGATLIVGLIMLLLLTLMVGSAFTLSGTNLKAVGNMQLRNEAIAAANAAIELKVSSDLTVAQIAEDIMIDINGDGVTDYLVQVTPECLSSTVASYASSSALSGEETKDYTGAGAPTVPVGYNVVLDFKADVNDVASGTSVTVRSAVRVLLNASEQASVCS